MSLFVFSSLYHVPNLLSYFLIHIRSSDLIPSLIQALISSSTNSLVHSCNSSLSSSVKSSIRVLVPLGIRRFETLKPITIKLSFPVLGSAGRCWPEAQGWHWSLLSLPLWHIDPFRICSILWNLGSLIVKYRKLLFLF